MHSAFLQTTPHILSLRPTANCRCRVPCVPRLPGAPIFKLGTGFHRFPAFLPTGSTSFIHEDQTASIQRINCKQGSHRGHGARRLLGVTAGRSPAAHLQTSNGILMHTREGQPGCDLEAYTITLEAYSCSSSWRGRAGDTPSSQALSHLAGVISLKPSFAALFFALSVRLTALLIGSRKMKTQTGSLICTCHALMLISTRLPTSRVAFLMSASQVPHYYADCR